MKHSHTIRTTGMGQAWARCLGTVHAEGTVITNPKGEVIKELLNVLITVARPSLDDPIIKRFGKKERIDFMKKNFFSMRSVKGFGYSYGQRLFKYNNINQIEWIIKRLCKDHTAKSATINLMKPGFDNRHVPCLTMLDFKIRNKALMVSVFLRSQDIFKKMYADMVCIAELQQLVAQSLEVKTGSLTFFIVSAHIYRADFAQCNKLCRRMRSSKERI